MEEKQQLAPDLAYAILSRFPINLPFVFSLKSEPLLDQTSSKFQLTVLEKEKLRNLIFNFGLKSFIENEFGHKLTQKS